MICWINATHKIQVDAVSISTTCLTVPRVADPEHGCQLFICILWSGPSDIHAVPLAILAEGHLVASLEVAAQPAVGHSQNLLAHQTSRTENRKKISQGEMFYRTKQACHLGWERGRWPMQQIPPVGRKGDVLSW